MIFEQPEQHMKKTHTHTHTITRKFEFDAGHRIPNHNSQCKNIHGHRYVLELTLQGDIITSVDSSDFGMIIDFGDIKSIINNELIQKWDHAFLVYEKDEIILHFLNSLPNHKTVVLDCVPTAENLVYVAFMQANQALNKIYAGKICVVHAKLYETPNCWAEYGNQR
jgi:6-pyruvoyltetrahydropterin/6-carboxytetrahydropterin synthase